MELKKLRLLFANIFFVVPCLCQLPAFPMPGDATTEPPPAVNQQQQPPAQTVLVPKVDFDFKGFFDYFVKIYGKNALSVFQERLDMRKKDEGLVVSSVPGVPIPCSLAQQHSGASLTYENPNRAHGTTATYRCDAGYKGTDVIVMCVSGSWTGANVSCELVYCGRPGPMPNGRVNFQDTSYGATATYTCDPSFQADDIASPVRCQADGTWSKPTFRCTNMMASTQQMSNTMAGGGMGMMGNMAAMMQAMSGGAGGMGGAAAAGGSGLNTGLMGAIAQAMSSATPGAGGAAGGGLGAMMTSMMGNPMGGGAASVGTAALPEHLQMLGSMAPALMPNFLGGLSPNFGMAGGMGAGAAHPPLEPEQQRDQMMMVAMMQSMQRQRMMEMQRQRQQEQLRQQQLEAQKKQQQQQQGSPSNAINLANLIPLASGTSGTQGTQNQNANPSATASMMTALQSLQTALSQMMGSQAQGTGVAASSGSGSGSSSSSSSSGSSQPTSVFGSNAPSSASGSTDALRDAVMAAGLGSG